MSKDDHQRMDSLNELNYCEDYERSMSRTDCLPAEDSTGAALRKNILTGLAKTACTANPLEAWAATEAKNYNQRTPRKDYDWEAIAAKLGAPSTANNEQMAQTIACKQADLKPTIKDDKFTIDGKLGPKTISTLDLQEQTTEYVKKQKSKPKKTSDEILLDLETNTQPTIQPNTANKVEPAILSVDSVTEDLISHKETNPIKNNNFSMSKQDTTKKQDQHSYNYKRIREYYKTELGNDIKTYLYSSPKAKAAGFSDLGCTIDDKLSNEEKEIRLTNAIKVFIDWQHTNMMLEVDGKFGSSGMIILDPDNFDTYYAEKSYAALNVDNIHKGERDSAYDDITEQAHLSDFQKGVLAAITIEHKDKHLGDITGDDGLAFGILHFTEKSKFIDYLELFYKNDFNNITKEEITSFRNSFLKEFKTCEELKTYLSLSRNNLWTGDNKYLLHLQKEKKFDFLVSLFTSDIGRRIQIELATNTMRKKINKYSDKFGGKSKLTMGSAAICAAFGNSTNEGKLSQIDANTIDTLLGLQIQAGEKYINCKTDSEGKNTKYKNYVISVWSQAITTLNSNQSLSISYTSEVSKANSQFASVKSFHRFKRMLLVLENFKDVWNDPYSENSKIPTSVPSPTTNPDIQATSETKDKPIQIPSVPTVEDNSSVLSNKSTSPSLNNNQDTQSTLISKKAEPGTSFIKFVKVKKIKQLYKSEGSSLKNGASIPENTVVPLFRDEQGNEHVTFYGQTFEVKKGDYIEDNVITTDKVELDKSMAIDKRKVKEEAKKTLPINTEIRTLTKASLKAKAAKKSKELTKVKADRKFTILDADTEPGCEYPWYQICYNKKTGYISGEYVDKADNAILTEDKTQILMSNVNACVGHITRDLAKTNDNFKDFNSGTYDNNCANFVSYMLRSVGVLSENIGTCSGLRSALSSLGWGCKPVSEALKSEETYPQSGDVWFSPNADNPAECGGHTEIVISTDQKTEKGKNKNSSPITKTFVTVIGSNNVDNVQVVSKSYKTDGFIFSKRYK